MDTMHSQSHAAPTLGNSQRLSRNFTRSSHSTLFNTKGFCRVFSLLSNSTGTFKLFTSEDFHSDRKALYFNRRKKNQISEQSYWPALTTNSARVLLPE